MGRSSNQPFDLSRRSLLQSAGVAALALGWPTAASAQTRLYRRPNVTSAAGKKCLASLAKAIKAMLALPPTDARNFYRIAINHVLDCPHGNWWFLPWHRGYIGWFERMCRELSGDPDFALPYWDWTAEPRIPADMFEDVLTPTGPGFIDSFDEFKRRFASAVAGLDCWKVVRRPDGSFDDTSPYAQLLSRSFRNPADLWFDIFEDPRTKLFFDLAHARGPTRLQPELDDNAKKAVSLPTLLDALAPNDFVTFGSPKAPFHAAMTGYGVLEGQPHNGVHACIGGVSMQQNHGGFMQGNLSPIDPIFWLHHANLDRIWDVWTRKQTYRNGPIMPDGVPEKPGDARRPLSDFAAWASEPFLFFVDENGDPVRKWACANYAEIGDFSYDYEPGSGEEVVAMALAPTAMTGTRTFPGQVSTSTVGPGSPSRSTVSMPANMLDGILASAQSRLFARVTVAFRTAMHAVPLRLNVGGMNGASDAPGFAGMLSMFGHHRMSGPMTFLVPLSAPARAMRGGNALRSDAPLDLTISQMGDGGNPDGHASGASAEILSVAVEVH